MLLGRLVSFLHARGTFMEFFLRYFFFCCNVEKYLRKDLDELTNSIDVSSNEETLHDENTQLPVILVTGSVLQTMSTLDDVDDDEAFIHELMAMHPNDDDIVVEDLEAKDDDLLTLQESLRTEEAVVPEMYTAPETYAAPDYFVVPASQEVSIIAEDLTAPEPTTDNDDDGVRMLKAGAFLDYRSLVRSWSFAFLLLPHTNFICFVEGKTSRLTTFLESI